MVKVAAIIIAIFLRLVPHLPNFTPVGAMALFIGTYFGKKTSVIIVLTTLLISDYLLLYFNPHLPNFFNFHKLYTPAALVHSTSVFVYASFLINVGVGYLIAKRKSATNIIIGSLTCSIQFFLVTNFGVWATGAYHRNINGLLESYIMGLPFFKYTLLGDLFYTTLLFGLYTLAIRLKIGKIPVYVR